MTGARHVPALRTEGEDGVKCRLDVRVPWDATLRGCSLAQLSAALLVARDRGVPEGAQVLATHRSLGATGIRLRFWWDQQ